MFACMNWALEGLYILEFGTQSCKYPWNWLRTPQNRGFIARTPAHRCFMVWDLEVRLHTRSYEIWLWRVIKRSPLCYFEVAIYSENFPLETVEIYSATENGVERRTEMVESRFKGKLEDFAESYCKLSEIHWTVRCRTILGVQCRSWVWNRAYTRGTNCYFIPGISCTVAGKVKYSSRRKSCCLSVWFLPSERTRNENSCAQYMKALSSRSADNRCWKTTVKLIIYDKLYIQWYRLKAPNRIGVSRIWLFSLRNGTRITKGKPGRKKKTRRGRRRKRDLFEGICWLCKNPPPSCDLVLCFDCSAAWFWSLLSTGGQPGGWSLTASKTTTEQNASLNTLCSRLAHSTSLYLRDKLEDDIFLDSSPHSFHCMIFILESSYSVDYSGKAIPLNPLHRELICSSFEAGYLPRLILLPRGLVN